MTETTTLLALFNEIEPTSDAIGKLHEMGVSDDSMEVISGVAVRDAMLGRPEAQTSVPRYALVGAVFGMLVGLFLMVGTPTLYPAFVGGQPLVPIPPTVVVIFEMTMLGLMAFTFIGVFLESVYPDFSPKEYVPEISDGKLALLFACPVEEQSRYEKVMKTLGAVSVRIAEKERL